MKNGYFNRNTEAAVAALPASKLSPFLQSALLRGHRKVRIVLPAVPRPHPCSTDRKIRAAARAAELAAWQASGGDYLRSSTAAAFIRGFQPRFN